MSTRWKKTPCETNACVEVGALSYGEFAIRNSMFRANTVVFTKKEMQAFIRAVKVGVFDDLIEGPR